MGEVIVLQIETYSGKYDGEIISLILDIQNKEAKIDLSIEEQPDLLDINHYYQQDGRYQRFIHIREKAEKRAVS